MSHKDLTVGEVHIVHNAVYSNRAAREAATYAAADIGKIVKQTDENSYWIVLTSGSGTATFAKISYAYGESQYITGNTATTIWSYTIPEGSSLVVEATVTARQGDSTDRNLYNYMGYFYRQVGGSAAQQGSTVALITPIESEATPTVEFAVSGNNVLLRWTGKAGERWKVIPQVEYSLNVT